jgi:aminoglycoside phosphotransferase (APT) family kinase protein
MTVSDDDIGSLLRQRFVESEAPSPDHAFGHQDNVYLIDGEHGTDEYVVKFCKRNSAHVLKYFPPTAPNAFAVTALAVEARVLRAIATRTSLPVPEVLAVNLSSDGDLPPYLVMEKAPGDSLHGLFYDLSVETQEHLLAAIGRYLATLHQTWQFDACGSLQLVDDAIEPVDDYRWPEWCDAQWATCLERLHETRFADLVPELDAWYETQRPLLPADQQSVLVHDDFRPANVLVDEPRETVTAMLDWEDILAAPPEYQLARLEFLCIDVYEFPAEQQAQLRTTLYESYQQIHPFQPSDAYRQRRDLYQLLSILWKTGNFPVTHQETAEERRSALATQRRHRLRQLIEE